MRPNEDSDSQEEMKSTRNDKCMWKYMINSLFFFKL